MCLILLAHGVREDLPLVVLANRDEFHERPSASLHQWDDHPSIIAGRDLSAGGTWMGISRGGRFAAVTNFRDPAARTSAAGSRGHLVRDFLLSTESTGDFAARLRRQRHAYRDFNLLFGDRQSLHCYSSHLDTLQAVPAGIHGLSNQHLNTPWPKVETGRAALRRALAAEAIDAAALLHILADAEPAGDRQLPDTGLPPALESALSAIFIVGADYGTRCSSLLSIDGAGHVEFVERSFAADGTARGSEHIAFEL